MKARPVTTTSIHRLNGDRHLSVAGKVAYFGLNWLNNQAPESDLDPRMTIRDFHLPEFPGTAPASTAGASPSRKLCDLFWATLPWARIEEELGSIHVLDVGCGRGGYARRLMSWSGDRVSSYCGTDLLARGEWTQLAAEDPRIRFVHGDAVSTIRDEGATRNFVMSQSTLEHIDDDLHFFVGVRDYLARRGGTAMQVHLCPSPACLRLYMLHGVRQYTPRTLSKITRLFDDSYAVVYRLGGRACNRVHYQYITAPMVIWRTGDRRITDAEEYERDADRAIEEDMRRPQRSPAFYALVIHSGARNRVF